MMTAFSGDVPLQKGGGQHDEHAGTEAYIAAPPGSKKPRASPLAAPYDTASWLSRLFFCWVNPVTSRCLNSSIRAELLPPLSAADEAELKRGALDSALRREEITARHPSILRATLMHFWPALLTATLWSVLRELLSFASTFLLKDLLADDEKEGPKEWQRGLVVAGALSGVQLLLVFLDSHLDFYNCRIMIRVETALLTSLYKRILNTGAGGGVPSVCIRSRNSRLSQTSRSCLSDERKEGGERQIQGRETAHKGALFNVIFVDIPSAAEMVLTALDLIVMPLRIALAVILLVVQVGASCVPGVLTLFVLVFCTISLTAYNATLKVPFMRTRDARLERSHECLTEMRTLRLLGWEDIAEDLVNRRREKEMGWLSFRMFLAGVSYWLTSVAGRALQRTNLFWWRIVLQALSMRPELVIPLIEARKDLSCEMRLCRAIQDPALKVRFLKASFCWRTPVDAFTGVSMKAEKDGGPVVISKERVGDTEDAALSQVTLDVKCGQVLLITGPPGSGKSTFLQSILQQDSLALTSGAIYVDRCCQMRGGNTENIFEELNFSKAVERSAQAPIGYVPQDPWLCGGTVRENIIFGDVFDVALYNEVVKACELSKDFASWRNGDLRVIDEGGLDLSGGQRVRVNIARAVYTCKMHQLRMNAEREHGKKEVERLQEHLLKCLVNAVAGEDESSAGVLEELKRKILCESQGSNEPAFSCLLCFDECFNSLDLSVAGHVFHNLFGPDGLLSDCAVILCLNKSSLLGLLHQHAGQEGFHKHRKERTPRAGANGDPTETDASTRMQFIICTLAEGSITWRGGVSDFIGNNEEFRPSGEVNASAATIEELLAVHAPCKGQDDYPGVEKGGTTFKYSHPSRSCEDIRTLAVAEHAATGRVQAASYIWRTSGQRASTTDAFSAFSPGSVRAARSLHQHLWAGVCNAPLWFYDQNPLGRILNRFAADVSVVDGGILRRIGYAFVAAVSFVLSVSLVYLTSLCFQLAGTVKRHSFPTRCISSWASIRVELMLFPLVVLNSTLPGFLNYEGTPHPPEDAASNDQSSIGLIGLAISYSISIAGALRRFLSNVTHMEKEMCSVERIQRRSGRANISESLAAQALRQHDDLTLWEALRMVGLDTTIASLPGGLELSTVLVGEGREHEERRRKKRMLSAKPFSKQDAHLLSAQQLRYLALGRLVADAPKLRLVLIDEPPAEEIWDQSSFKSVDGGDAGLPTAGGVEGPPLARAMSITDIITAHFQQASVIVVAHHLSSLRGCDRVWVLADGRKVGECDPTEIDTEQKFNSFVAACTEPA
ncbi:hypothetical protein ACSSS7_000730 [Eimeria intestinalis]